MTVVEARDVLAERGHESWDEWAEVLGGTELVTFAGELSVLVVEAGDGYWSLHAPDGSVSEVSDTDTLLDELNRMMSI